ncbi:MAG: protease pro-enzyme activation domain-containing protein [Acidimicrobiales bacterium]
MRRRFTRARRAAVGAAFALGSTLMALGTTVPAAHAAATGGWATTATQAVHLTNATEIGPLASSTPLSITVGLALHNQAALHSFITNTANPSSPDFGAAYSPASFTATYGPTAAQASAVAGYLTSQGFTGVSVTSNRILVTANGTAAQVDKAFNTVLDNYKQGGKIVYANPAPAMVPSALSGTVVAVLGLNNVFKFSASPVKPSAVPASAPAAVSKAFSAASSLSTSVPRYPYEYSPQGFWQAYQANGQATGSKTAIATFSEGNLTNPLKNLRTEEALNHLPAVPVTVEQVGVPLSVSMA